MNTANLKKIAKEVLNEEGQLTVDELLRKGKIETAKEYLLGGIDSCYDRGIIGFEEAAGLYNMLELPPERASMFRRRIWAFFIRKCRLVDCPAPVLFHIWNKTGAVYVTL